MNKIRSILWRCLLAAAFFSGFMFSRDVLSAQDRVPLTATTTESMYDPSGNPTHTNAGFVAIRSDASTARGRSIEKPGDRGLAVQWRFLDLSNAEEIIVDGLTDSFMTVPMSRLRVKVYRQATSCAGGGFAPRGSMLGYDVVRTVRDRSGAGRFTRHVRLLAPALDCFPMKEIFLVGASEADLHVANVKEVTQVKVGEPDASLFETPADYVEKSESERRREFGRRYSGSRF